MIKDLYFLGISITTYTLCAFVESHQFWNNFTLAWPRDRCQDIIWFWAQSFGDLWRSFLSPDWSLSLDIGLWLAVDVLTGCWLLTPRLDVLLSSSKCPPSVSHCHSVCSLMMSSLVSWFICCTLIWSLIGRGRSRDLSSGLWLVDPLRPHNLSGPGLWTSGSSSESSAVITSCKEKITSTLPCNSHTFY